jgi:hypothetical protein
MEYHKEYLCPFCGNKLARGEDEEYETLMEHVEDPNGEYGDPGKRETWVCSCSMSVQSFWDAMGDFYTDAYMHASVLKKRFGKLVAKNSPMDF